MDVQTAKLPPVSVVKGSTTWAYTDHKNHWVLVSQDENEVTIRHASKGGEFTISAPDRVIRHPRP